MYYYSSAFNVSCIKWSKSKSFNFPIKFVHSLFVAENCPPLNLLKEQYYFQRQCCPLVVVAGAWNARLNYPQCCPLAVVAGAWNARLNSCRSGKKLLICLKGVNLKGGCPLFSRGRGTWRHVDHLPDATHWWAAPAWELLGNSKRQKLG